MRKFLLPLAATLFVSQVWAADPCEEDAVDMADSLDFHTLHVECANDPVTLYDPQSKSNFFSKKKKAVTTYADTAKAVPATAVVNSSMANGLTQQNISAPVSAAAEPTTLESIENNAGVVFNIREPFTLTGGPQSALNGLYVQMAHYCPKGWTKNEEWVEPAQAGYFLHYQFQCAE